jgi:biofilm PGA synthesis N-glycosyltransferase PgaC
MSTPGWRYAVVTPARDEAAHIGRTMDAMASQTLPPVAWIVVDDGSSDGTGALVEQRAKSIPWLQVLVRRDRGRRVAGGGVVEAFDAGCERLPADWDFLVKLDADLSFAPDYFARCLRHFEQDPRLGIGGGLVMREEAGRLVIDSAGDPPFHVRGASKIYRRACWERIAPLLRAAGWDTVDEVKANLHGWTTRTFDDLPVVQLKPTGSVDGAWRNALKNGRANYIAGYHPLFMAAKCLRRLARPPFGSQALALAAGYCSGYARQLPRVEADVIRYLRRQQLRRLLMRPSIYG